MTRGINFDLDSNKQRSDLLTNEVRRAICSTATQQTELRFSGPCFQPLFLHLRYNFHFRVLANLDESGQPASRCEAACQNLTAHGTWANKTRATCTLAPYHVYPMCLGFLIRGQRKSHSSEGTPLGTPLSETQHHRALEDPEAVIQPAASGPVLHQQAITETPAGFPPHVEQQPQIPAVPGNLPSQVDETLAECPR